MSEQDIDTGKRWRQEVAHHLATIKIGVLCLTPESVDRPWLNFEAGALSRTVDDTARVCGYCFDLKPTDYGDPLGDFNAVAADEPGTWQLVRSINSALDGPIEEAMLQEAFSALWPKLAAALKEVPARPAGTRANRPQHQIVEEVLRRMRRLERRIEKNTNFLAANRIDQAADVHAALAKRIAEAGPLNPKSPAFRNLGEEIRRSFSKASALLDSVDDLEMKPGEETSDEDSVEDEESSE